VPEAELSNIKLEVENDRKSLGGIHQEKCGTDPRFGPGFLGPLPDPASARPMRQNEELRNTADKIHQRC
jgi:hypothetical protein